MSKKLAEGAEGEKLARETVEIADSVAKKQVAIDIKKNSAAQISN